MKPMIKVKTSDLIGSPLNWALAMALRIEVKTSEGRVWLVGVDVGKQCFEPSTDWSQFGPIAEEHLYRLDKMPQGTKCWAQANDLAFIEAGPTRPIAGCRAIVAKNLGSEVSVPAELYGSDLHQVATL